MSDDNVKNQTAVTAEQAGDDASGPFVYENLSRRAMRSLIFHYLYAMESFDYDVSLESIVDNFNRGFELNVPLDGEAFIVTRSVIEERHMLDDEIKPLLSNWNFDRLGVSTKLILRMALWELANTSIDSSIVINEAIELAKCFAEKDAYKFINGLLDEKVHNTSSKNVSKED